VMDRKYSLVEIDAMREAISKRIGEPTMRASMYMHEYEKWWTDHYARVENELRTHMMNGTDPAELIDV
jgi:hypothetical protein